MASRLPQGKSCSLARLERSEPSTLYDQVEKSWREAALVVRLDEAQLQVSDLPVNDVRDFAAADRAYEAAFKEYGLKAASLSAEEFAARIRASAIRSRLVTALDYWAYVKGRLPNGDAEPLWAIARMADGDAWRQRLRDPNSVKDRRVLESLAEENNALAQAPAYLLILGRLLDQANAREAAVRLLRRARKHYSADFWLNFKLAMLLRYDRRASAEAVGLCRVAIALQSQSPIGYRGLAAILEDEGNRPECIAAVRKSIELNPKMAASYEMLGTCLYSQQKLSEAEAVYRTAVELKPDFAGAYYNLACVLYLQGRLPEALEASQTAVKLGPDFPNAFNTLGVILRALGKLSEAQAAQRQGH